MALSDFTKSDSEFMRKEELPKPPLGLRVKIVDVSTHQFEGEEPKLVLIFHGKTNDVNGNSVKPLLCNKTNVQMLGQLFTDVNDEKQLIGKVIELFNDLSVSFNGKIGGIRIRPDGTNAAVTAAAVKPAADPNDPTVDDIPF